MKNCCSSYCKNKNNVCNICANVDQQKLLYPLECPFTLLKCGHYIHKHHILSINKQIHCSECNTDVVVDIVVKPETKKEISIKPETWEGKNNFERKFPAIYPENTSQSDILYSLKKRWNYNAEKINKFENISRYLQSVASTSNDIVPNGQYNAVRCKPFLPVEIKGNNDASLSNLFSYDGANYKECLITIKHPRLLPREKRPSSFSWASENVSNTYKVKIVGNFLPNNPEKRGVIIKFRKPQQLNIGWGPTVARYYALLKPNNKVEIMTEYGSLFRWESLFLDHCGDLSNLFKDLPFTKCEWKITPNEQCIVCMDQESDAAFAECECWGVCKECADIIIKSGNLQYRKCPKCNEKVVSSTILSLLPTMLL